MARDEATEDGRDRARERGRGQGDGRRGRGREGRSPLELAAIAISALLVAGALALLVRQGVRGERPAALVTTVDSVVARGEAHQAYVSVRNLGDGAAARALVRARLLRAGEPVAESEATIDWVPGRSVARAILLFRDDPRGAEIDAWVVGFTAP